MTLSSIHKQKEKVLNEQKAVQVARMCMHKSRNHIFCKTAAGIDICVPWKRRNWRSLLIESRDKHVIVASSVLARRQGQVARRRV